MMFRIHFNSRGAFWCLQFSRFGLFWVTMRKHGEVIKFDTHDDADQYVIDRGIEAAYIQWIEPSLRAQRDLESDPTPLHPQEPKTPPASPQGLGGAMSEGDFIDLLSRGRATA